MTRVEFTDTDGDVVMLKYMEPPTSQGKGPGVGGGSSSSHGECGLCYYVNGELTLSRVTSVKNQSGTIRVQGTPVVGKKNSFAWGYSSSSDTLPGSKFPVESKHPASAGGGFSAGSTDGVSTTGSGTGGPTQKVQSSVWFTTPITKEKPAPFLWSSSPKEPPANYADELVDQILNLTLQSSGPAPTSTPAVVQPPAPSVPFGSGPFGFPADSPAETMSNSFGGKRKAGLKKAEMSGTRELGVVEMKGAASASDRDGEASKATLPPGCDFMATALGVAVVLHREKEEEEEEADTGMATTSTAAEAAAAADGSNRVSNGSSNGSFNGPHGSISKPGLFTTPSASPASPLYLGEHPAMGGLEGRYDHKPLSSVKSGDSVRLSPPAGPEGQLGFGHAAAHVAEGSGKNENQRESVRTKSHTYGLIDEVAALRKQASALKELVDAQAALFVEPLEQLRLFSSTMQREQPEVDGESAYWKEGEGKAKDVTAAALGRLKRRVACVAEALETYLEKPSAELSYFIGCADY